jgi:hypothetical protein
MLRSGNVSTDFDALGAIVDAFKHYELADRRRPRLVRSAQATVTTDTGLGQLGFGEGKYGGVTETIVTFTDGRTRAFSSIIQNVVDMWRCAFGLQLPPIGE